MQILPVRFRLTAKRPIAILGLTLVMAATAAGCGSGGETGGAAAPPPAGSGSNQSAGVLPDLSVTDVESGSEVSLQSLVPADRPVLLWFWAPH